MSGFCKCVESLFAITGAVLVSPDSEGVMCWGSAVISFRRIGLSLRLDSVYMVPDLDVSNDDDNSKDGERSGSRPVSSDNDGVGLCKFRIDDLRFRDDAGDCRRSRLLILSSRLRLRHIHIATLDLLQLRGEGDPAIGWCRTIESHS